jgi:1-acyl-sn-glycerol-3-phosphate acyltransferase
MSPTMGDLLPDPRGPVEAYVRMLAAFGEDLAGAVTGSGPSDPSDPASDPSDPASDPSDPASDPSDPFGARDPAYIERTLPALRLMSKLYFRATVRGLENIPADGPVLLVGNHSGGAWIADTFVFSQMFYDHFGPSRRFHQLAHDLVFKLAGLRALVQRYGTVPASPANMATALDRGAALLVYPGGDHETFRPSWESGELDFAGRTGFVKLALEHRVPIVPVVSIGGQETALFLGRGRRLARWLRLDDQLRLKVLPSALGPPFGLTVLDLPLRVPLPAKISIEVLEPIDLGERVASRGGVDDGYELVTTTMQETLTRLSEARTLPVVG